ncbi:MAG: Tn3 family transposase [Hyphomicrobiales bacterium]|nr:Tn3 family transposase [Hyphomicrobiales bacterium]
MARRRLLQPDRWSVLLNPPTDEDSLVRNYTMSGDDLDRALRKRGHHNQLGFAVQFCLMRHIGRPLAQNDAVPAEVISFIAGQLGVTSAVFADYGRRDNTRREHSAELQELLGLRMMTRTDQRAALVASIDAAAATDNGETIAAATIAAFRSRNVLLPSTDKLERIGTAGRAVARKRVQTSLLEGLTPERLEAFEQLLMVDPAIRQTRFAWLRALPEAPSERNLLGLIERLIFVRSFGLDPQRRARIHPDRWTQLVREGAVTPSWLADDFNAGRRQALIAAQLIELTSKLTDATITMFCRLIALLFTKSKARQDRRHLDARKETGRLLRMFGDTLRVLVEANETGEDTFEVLDREIGWHRLVRARADVEALATTAEADPLLGAAERYSWVRRYAPALLDVFTFRSARTLDPLLTAIDLLRQLNRDDRRGLPAKVPLGHLIQKVRKLIAANGQRDRRLWEIATLAVLRERLRSGDVWVEGGRAFRPLEAQLMPGPAFVARKEAGDLRLGVPRGADAWIAEKEQELDFKLKRLSHQARTGKLAGVRMEDGVLIISQQRTKVPKAKVDAAKWLILDRMPQIDITDLLAEVNTWTGFAQWFTHLRTGDTVRLTPALLAAILGDATNLGAKRMADASAGLSERQITWARLFHIRPETYKAALAAIINAHLAHPFAKLWGNGTTSSSDGQFFRAGGRGAKRGDVNAHYSGDPGSKFYTWVSDQHGHFHILPMGATEDEAVYVLDGLYGHETRIEIDEHYVDTGGASDHVFSLFTLGGKRVAPRLRDLKDWRLHAFEDADSYPTLKHHIGDRIDTAAIREGWDEALRIGVSIEDRIVVPSTVLKKLAALPKTNVLSRALREIGRIERTLFMIEWYSSPELRDRCRAGLNKGEAGNKLTRAVFFHERGEIRDGSFESQAFRASGLNLVVSAIVLWNTVYLSRAVESLRAEGRDLPDDVIRHISPQIWEHINLTGIYDWMHEHQPEGTFRPLRIAKENLMAAA